MQEVKKPKKPLIFYYVIVLLVLLLFNFLAMPWLAQRQIQEVDYGTFMDMAAKQELQADHRAGEPDTHLPRQLGTAHRHLCGPR